MFRFFFNIIQKINTECQIDINLAGEIKHKDDIDLSDLKLPNKFKEEDENGEFYDIIIEDMTEIEIDIMVKQLVKDGFGTKDYVEKNYGLPDYFRNALINKFNSYCEKVYSDRARDRDRAREKR